MPRPQRQEREGAIYHVFARGVNRMRVFVDHEDYRRYLSLLAATVARQGWNLLGYCLMPNHVHLLIETPQPNLASGMQWLHGLYAQTFNKRHARVGHLFQDRYRCEPMRDDGHLPTLVAYVAMNPVAAVLCNRPEEWPWSSHALITARAAPEWLAHTRLLELFGGPDAGGRYDTLIEERLSVTLDPTLK
jgi:REP element-mobilizing transposase RayT